MNTLGKDYGYFTVLSKKKITKEGFVHETYKPNKNKFSQSRSLLELERVSAPSVRKKLGTANSGGGAIVRVCCSHSQSD